MSKLLACVYISLAIFKLLVIFLVIFPYFSVRGACDNTHCILEYITTCGIVLSVLHNLGGFVSSCCCPEYEENEENKENEAGCINSCILFIVYFNPFITSCWIADEMRIGNIVDNEYNMCLWLVLTYFSGVIFVVLILCFYCMCLLKSDKIEPVDNFV